ncbi:large ribosomal subunit protein cL37 [Malania oleifera]|uniref:large ribosomal subunit protein cL37 n=1 Tax=Malania oleifera TaxID=397392 RepID=UPI0025ADA396|nr:large ribosomal subunit protein cL37 [Malania oleifera]
MALLLFNPFTSISSSSCTSLATTMVVTTSPISQLHNHTIDVHLKSFNRIRTYVPLIGKERSQMIAKASSDINEIGIDGGDASSESEEEVLPVDKLPLESKLQQRLEQKMRMKIAKKIRLRRKRLLRKRRMRKKGRWPPSKMKKNKNV